MSKQMSKQIGFIGLGQMGVGMARNLQKLLSSDARPGNVDPSLRVSNRTASKAIALESEGCTAVATPADLGGCSIVFAMLFADAQIEEALGQYVEAATAAGTDDPIFVTCTTILPETTKRLAAEAANKGVTVMACTVFGRPHVAAAGALTSALSGGVAATREEVKALVAGFSGKIHDLGDEAPAANTLKVCGNFVIFSQLEIVSEYYALGIKNGVDLGVMRDLFDDISRNVSPVYSKLIAKGGYLENVGAPIELAVKDLSYARRLGDASGTPLPLVDVVLGHLTSARAHFGPDADCCAVDLVQRLASNLPPDAGRGGLWEESRGE